MNRSIFALLVVATRGFGVAQLKANIGNPTQPVTPAH